MNTTTALLILHGLLAVALLGAVTHQAVSVLAPVQKPAGSFVGRFRGVASGSYVNAVVALYVITTILGSVIYPDYRLNVRLVLEQLELKAQNGAFELKEHFAVIGLAMLPAYWYYWRHTAGAGQTRSRAVITTLLAFIVWWNFLVGHILNNIRGFGS
jgi:hypothetical protein